MILMEYAKFMFKFNNQKLPVYFDNYFIKLENVHNYDTRKKFRNEYFQSFKATETGRKALHHICVKIWTNVSPNYRNCSFAKFKKYFKSNR